MLKKIKYKVKIKVPAKTLEQDLDFPNGLTGITGPNGMGKSMIVEMVQYLLFGNSALRGKADDYEMIDGLLEFVLRERDFIVARTKNKATLSETVNGELKQLASGTSAVNLKIEELFGYSKAVFQVANVCNQGKIEELGEMLPTARKRLVDETIGLNVLDDILLFIDGKRKDLNTTIGAVEGMLTEPVKPVDPEMAYSSDYYKRERDALSDERQRRTGYQIAAGKVLVEPIQPVEHHFWPERENFKVQQARRMEIITEATVLDRDLKSIPPAPANLVTTLEADDHRLDEYQKIVQDAASLDMEISVNQRGLDRYKWTEPVVSLEELTAYSARNALVKRWEDRAKLMAKNVPHDCPKCHHHWEDEDPRIKSEFGDVPDERPEVLMSDSNINAASINLRNYEAGSPIQKHLEELKAKRANLEPGPAAERIKSIVRTRKEYHESMVAVQNQGRREQLVLKLQDLNEEIKGLPDRTDDLAAIQKYAEAEGHYHILRGIYNSDLKQKEAAQIELAKFPDDLDEKITVAEGNYIGVLNYENNMVHYTKAKGTYDKAMEQVANLKSELEQWTAARSAVADVRAKVKGYLLPSLNTVASILINQMTGGELSHVVVNEQFEIAVDGQRIETLSGAGKSVANLALRIGLGQVLTNRVFSVMMLDEIDAACDENRAKYIAECLMNLTKTIGQVIQVSHKAGLVADNHVRL